MRGGRGVMPNTFEANMRPFMSVIKNKLFSDHFIFFRLLFFCLFLSIHCLFNGLESLLQETWYHLSKYFVNSRDPYSYKCNVK